MTFLLISQFKVPCVACSFTKSMDVVGGTAYRCSGPGFACKVSYGPGSQLSLPVLFFALAFNYFYHREVELHIVVKQVSEYGYIAKHKFPLAK